MQPLTAIEHDALIEFLNLGIGRAARSLSLMVDQEILLEVPKMRALPMNEVKEYLEQEYAGQVASVRQSIAGPLRGDVVTIFASDDSLQLVRALLKEDVPMDVLTELEREALMEVGNVVQNACVAAIANQLQLEIQTSIPDSKRGVISDALRGDDEAVCNSVLFFRINFHLAESNITGHLILTLGIDWDSAFRTHLQRYIAQMTGGNSNACSDLSIS